MYEKLHGSEGFCGGIKRKCDNHNASLFFCSYSLFGKMPEVELSLDRKYDTSKRKTNIRGYINNSLKRKNPPLSIIRDPSSSH